MQDKRNQKQDKKNEKCDKTVSGLEAKGRGQKLGF